MLDPNRLPPIPTDLWDQHQAQQRSDFAQRTAAAFPDPGVVLQQEQAQRTAQTQQETADRMARAQRIANSFPDPGQSLQQDPAFRQARAQPAPSTLPGSGTAAPSDQAARQQRAQQLAGQFTDPGDTLRQERAQQIAASLPDPAMVLAREQRGAQMAAQGASGTPTDVQSLQTTSAPSDAQSASQPSIGSPLVAKARAAATKYGIDPNLFEALGHNENLDNPDAVSPAGAIGPYQLMPTTAQSLGVDPTNYDQNIDGAARYFKQMLDYYHGDTAKAVSAYNSGPGNVDRGTIPDETRAYTQRVLSGASFSGTASAPVATTKATMDPAGSGEASPDTKLTTALDIANQQMGKPYVWGGTDPAGFDCSGLVQYAYGKAGIELPRTADQQYQATTPVKADQAQAGDLVFFSATDPQHPDETISHVGIYLGGGKMLNAPTEGSPVQVQSIDSGFWAAHIAGFGRVAGAGGAVAQNPATDAPVVTAPSVAAAQRTAAPQPTYNAPFSDQQQPVVSTVTRPQPDVGAEASATASAPPSLTDRIGQAAQGIGATVGNAAGQAAQTLAPIAQTVASNVADLYGQTPQGRVSAVAQAAMTNPSSAPGVALAQITDTLNQMGAPRDLVQALLEARNDPTDPTTGVARNGLVDAFNQTDPNLPVVQRVRQALAIASAPFKAGGLQPADDPTGGILAGLDQFVRGTVTDPTMLAGGAEVPVKAMAAGAGIAGLGAGLYSRATGATPDQTAQNVQTGAGLGMLAGPAAESLAPLAGRAATLGAQGIKTLGEVGTEAGIVPGLSIKDVGSALDPRDAQARWTRAQVLATRAGEPLDFQSEMLAEDLSAIPDAPSSPAYQQQANQLYEQYAAQAARDLTRTTAQKLGDAQARLQGLQTSLDPGLVELAKVVKPVGTDFNTMTVDAYQRMTGVTPSDAATVLFNGRKYVNPDFLFDELSERTGTTSSVEAQHAIETTQRQLGQIAALRSQVASLKDLSGQARDFAAAYPTPTRATPTVDLSGVDRSVVQGQQAPLVPGQAATSPTPVPGAAAAATFGQGGAQGALPGVPPVGATATIPSVAATRTPGLVQAINEIIAPVRNTAQPVQDAFRSLAGRLLQAEVDGGTVGLTASRAMGKDNGLAAASLYERTGQFAVNPTPEQQALAQIVKQYTDQTGDLGRQHGYVTGDPVAAGTVAAYFPHSYPDAVGPVAGQASARSLNPMGTFSQAQRYPTLDAAVAAGAKPLDSVSGPLRDYAVGIQTSEAKVQFVNDLRAAAPEMVMEYKPSDPLPAGWRPGLGIDPQFHDLAFAPPVALALKNLFQTSELRSLAFGRAFLGALGASKETLFSLSGFHLLTELRQAYRANGIDGIPVIGKAMWNVLVPGAYDTFRLRNADAFSQAARAGVTGLGGTAADVGTTATGIAGLAARAATGSLAAGVGTYEASKASGADEQTARERGLVAAAIGAVAGPTLGRAINAALWERTVPTLKVLTYQIAKESGADAASAADFTNNVYGGQNLAAIARAPWIQDLAHLAVLAPDWWESWANQLGNAIKPGAAGNLSRGYWLRTAVVDGAIGLEALNIGLNGHSTADNEPGHQFALETTGLYDTMGWDHTDHTTGVPYRTYFDVLGPIATMLQSAVEGPGGGARFAVGRLGLAPRLLGNAVWNKDLSTGQPIVPKGTSWPQGALDQVGHALGSIAPIGIASGGKSTEPLPVTIASTVLGMRTSHSSYPAADPGTFLSQPTRDALAAANVSINLGAVGRSYGGTGLEPPEQQLYQQLSDQFTETGIRQLLADKDFKSATPAERTAQVRAVVTAARAQAGSQVLEGIGQAEIDRRFAASAKGSQASPTVPATPTSGPVATRPPLITRTSTPIRTPTPVRTATPIRTSTPTRAPIRTPTPPPDISRYIPPYTGPATPTR